MSDHRPLSCVMLGEGSLLVRCAEALLERGHDLRCVVSSSALIQRWAESRGVPVLAEPGALLHATSVQPFHYLFSVANLTLVPQAVLALAQDGAINFHDGPLPAYAGLHVPAWALINGEHSHGVTWHQMTDRIDAGDILIERTFPLSEDETSLTLNARCYEAGLESFGVLVDALSKRTVTPRPQPASARRYFARHQRPAAACCISWQRTAHDIGALVRALDFGTYPNPLGVPKLAVRDRVLAIREARVLTEAREAAAGTVLHIDDDALHVRARVGAVAIRGLSELDGTPVSCAELKADGIHEGMILPGLNETLAAQLTKLNTEWARHEAFWARRLAQVAPLVLPFAAPRTPAVAATVQESATAPAATVHGVPGLESRGASVAAAFLCYLARLTGVGRFDIGYRDRRCGDAVASVEKWFASHVPLRVEIETAQPGVAAMHSVSEELQRLQSRGSYARDLALRVPELRSQGTTTFPVVVERTDRLEQAAHAPGSALTVVFANDGAARWLYDARLLAAADLSSMQRQFGAFTEALRSNPDVPLSHIALITNEERRRLLETWNDTAVPVPNACIQDLFEAQVERTPDAAAVTFRAETLTFAALNARANQLAHRLRSAGVVPDALVGLCVERSIDLVVGLLGILKAGGAYVPLDPAYPAARLSFMLRDSRAAVLVTHGGLAKRFEAAGQGLRVIDLDEQRTRLDEAPGSNPLPVAVPSNLAYVIYTSGSTGTPKGVMVEHRNVVNCFSGMDARIPHHPAGVWLALTSLSFDISVLELLWTLTRGMHVVVQEDALHGLTAAAPPSSRPIDFSLFYFSSDDANDARDAYRLLLEGARYADTHGFSAVWTPERHFHAFGGLYPNPAVVGAAIASVTERVRIRAGSVVLPLHHPVRVAEEWAVVDNLSRGRVDISFASGWQPEDFVLRPENYAERRQIMQRDIAVVQRLWRGEAISLPDSKGKEVSVRTHPRPVQPELPIWLTAAGTTDTFAAAGALGAGVLTHLLGQTVEELTDKIAAYRAAWRSHGHGPSGGHVTLMLHTFVGESEEEVLATVRAPLTAYLQSSANLLKQYAASFPAFRNGGDGANTEFQNLNEEDMQALLDHAFMRYYQTSGLLGTPASCAAMIERLIALGVDEVACLIDFGVDADTVLDNLDNLDALRRRFSAISDDQDYSIAAQMRRHGVTHLQCTPSLARLLTSDPAVRPALQPLHALLIGGEALPPTLAAELRRSVQGRVLNMYGPTETTIWSTTHALNGADGPVSIGRPIANTDVYVLDAEQQAVPVGLAGELFIGGAGVARGYHDRPDLTRERFLPHPFRATNGERVYRTGDLVRYHADGTLEWLERIDQQVKIRGFRIELGEIELALARHPQVRESAVVVHESTPGEKQLVAFLVATPDTPPPNASEVRAYLAAQLPEYMVPATVLVLRELPLTPNGKVDRRSLAVLETAEPVETDTFVAPRTATEQEIAAVWSEVLGVKRLGAQDNFFEAGGDSLSAVRVVVRLRDRLHVPLALQHLFEKPTLAGLAAAIDQLAANSVPNTGARLTAIPRVTRRVVLQQD